MISEDSGFSGKSFIFQAGTTSRLWERSMVLRSAMEAGVILGTRSQERSVTVINKAGVCNAAGEHGRTLTEV